MSLLPLLPKLFIAGGAFLGTLDLPAPVQLMNHTLAGEKIPASQVVCRSRWGTPMLPDGKAGYSLIAPIRKDLIARSLWIPPISGTRPLEQAVPSAGPVAKPAGSPVAVPASGGVPAQ